MKKIEFSEEECLDIVNMYKHNISAVDIGKKYHCSNNPITKVLKRYGIVLDTVLRKVPKCDYDKVVNMYNSGMTQEEISKIYNCSKHVIYTIMKYKQADVRPNGFTSMDAEAMFLMHQSGKTFDEIANEYHTTRHTVGCVLKRNGYKIDRRTFSCNEHYFDIIDTQDKAYLLGLLWADGCNSVDIGKISLQLQEKDKGLLECLSKVTESNRPLQFTALHDKNPNWSNAYTLIWRSRHMSDILEYYGMIQRKSLVLEFPYFLNIDLYSHFIRGYMDGDGSISIGRNGVLQVSMIGTNIFINFIKDICDELHIKTYISYRKNGNESICTLGITNNKDRLKFLEWIYNDSNIKMDRKYQKYQQFLEYYNNINNSYAS